MKSIDPQHLVINPVLSPEGNKVAYTVYTLSETAMSLYIINFEGSENQLLSNNAGYEAIPSFSPDGKQIAFYGNDDNLYVMNVDGTNLHSVAEKVIIRINGYSGLDWSPQGDKIAYVDRTENYDADIFVVNSNGTGLNNLTNDILENYLPVWSANGDQIAYVNEPGDIWIMNLDGTGRLNLTNTPANLDIFPHWSPDGEKIVYTTV